MLRPVLIGCALLGAVAGTAPGTRAMAEDGAATCAAPVLPPAFAAWASPVPLSAATDKAGLPAATASVGAAVDATLPRTPAVRYLARPEKPGGTVSHGGLLAFTVKEAGTYRIALGTGAWIDVLKDGKAVPSSAHGHGPACSGIRKIVDFPLSPGRHVLQISASGAGQLRLLIVRAP